MPRNQNFRVIRHVFNGGYEPDSSPTVSVTPDQQGVVHIPHLSVAKNCLYELDGGPRKAWGTTALMSAVSETKTDVRGMFDYWLLGTSDTPAQHRVFFLDDAIYKDDGDGTFATIKTGLQTDTVVGNFSQFDDLLICCNDNATDVPMSWDGTTFQNLAGSPGNFSFTVPHSSHLFGSGVHSAPSTIYYSVPYDPEDWTNAGSGNIQVNPQDGDRVVGMISYKGKLLIFKGPHKGSVWVLSGTSSDDFSLAPLDMDVGAIWQNSIMHMADSVCFVGVDGHIYLIRTTDAFGNFSKPLALSIPISSWIEGRVNVQKLRYASCASLSGLGVAQFCLPIDGSSDPNCILHMDYRFNPPRFSPWEDFDGYTYLTTAIDPDNSYRPAFLYGGNDKRLWRAQRSARVQKSTAIDMDVKTPYMDYGDPSRLKTLNFLGLGLEPLNDGDITVYWARDDNAQQNVSISQGGSDVLGDADADEFTLGTSALGGARFDHRWYDIHNGGQFRAIQYEMVNSAANEDVRLYSITCGYEINGISLEN